MSIEGNNISGEKDRHDRNNNTILIAMVQCDYEVMSPQDIDLKELARAPFIPAPSSKANGIPGQSDNGMIVLIQQSHYEM